MSGARGRKIYFIETLPLILATGWGVATWQDIHAQIGRTTGWTRLLLGWALWVLLVGGLVWAVRMYRSLRVGAVVPMALSAVALAVMPFVAATATQDQEERFLAGTEPYLAYLGQVRAGAVSPGMIPSESLPSALAGCCLQVEVSRDSAGVVGGIFVTEMPFGPKFAGWLYSEASSVPSDTTFVLERYQIRKLTDRWYRLTQ